MKLLRVVLAIALPPLAVFLTTGISPALLINVLLTVLGWVPGMVHALWVVLKSYENADQREAY